MKYCTKCLIPSTKPNVKFDKNGTCFACQNYQEIKNLSKEALTKIVILINCLKKLKNKKIYDVVIPVSGGKDSLYQVYKTKKYTNKILGVCIDFGLRNEIGEHNLNIIQTKLNVDVIKFSINHLQIRKLALYSLEKFGDPDLFNHIAIYTIPALIAYKFDIPLILYGKIQKSFTEQRKNMKIQRDIKAGIRL